jgi:predicted SAM-dependent methyltransferase
LFDGERFCRKLEAAFIDIDQAHRQRSAAAPQMPLAEVPAAPVDGGSAGPAGVAARRLHIGGKVRSPGWEVINALPGPNVDHLGNANDLSRFAEHSFEVVYASHVVEHFDYRDELHNTLCEWLRVLKPGGAIEISVPDLEVLAGLILDKSLPIIDHFKVMMMMFGGHVDAYDHHKVGLTAEILGSFLLNAGFVDVQRVGRFGYFEDTSEMSFAGRSISLNMRARKPQ